MIIVNLMGGLGNQLFQYAAARALSNHHRTSLTYIFSDGYRLAKRSIQIDNFKIEATLLERGDVQDYLPKRKLSRVLYKLLGKNYEGRIYREKVDYDFDPDFFNLPDKCYLYGFWQSYSYFAGIENNIRQEIVIKDPSANYLRAEECIRKLPNPVSVHVRRGDYLHPKSGFSPVSEQYYRAGNRYILDQFGEYTPVIFTDDTAWVENNMVYMKGAIFASEFHLEDFEDLMLMSKCNHHIIANSSFSWWGAWLNVNPDKCVVAPSDWHSMHSDNSKLIPPSWIQIS